MTEQEEKQIIDRIIEDFIKHDGWQEKYEHDMYTSDYWYTKGNVRFHRYHHSGNSAWPVDTNWYLNIGDDIGAYFYRLEKEDQDRCETFHEEKKKEDRRKSDEKWKEKDRIAKENALRNVKL